MNPDRSEAIGREATPEGGSEGRRDHCLNCGARLSGPYCSRCGQADIDPDAGVGELVRDFFSAAFDWDSRLARTLRGLLRPGLLTVEWVAGRRRRYLPPVRLFFLGTVIVVAVVTWAAGPELGRLPGWPEGESAVTPERVVRTMTQAFVWVTLLLIPIFAALLRLTHRGRGDRYVHHLIFSIHYHTFAFLALAAALAPFRLLDAKAGKWALLSAAGLVSFAYLVLAMRRVYGRSTSLTLLKASAIYYIYLSLVVPFSALPVTWVVSLLIPELSSTLSTR